MRRFLLLFLIPLFVLAQEEPPEGDFSCMVSYDEGAGIVSFDVPRCAVDVNGNGMIDDCSELLECFGGVCPVDSNDSLCTAGSREVKKPKRACGDKSFFESGIPVNYYQYREWLSRYNLRCADVTKRYFVCKEWSQGYLKTCIRGEWVVEEGILDKCEGIDVSSYWRCGDTHGCTCPQGMTYNEQTRKCEASPQCPPHYVSEDGLCKAKKALDAAGREWDLSMCHAIENTIVDGKEKIWCTVHPWQALRGGGTYSLCDYTGNVRFRWYVDDDPQVYVYRCKSDRYVANCVRRSEENREPSSDCWLGYDTRGKSKDKSTPSSGDREFYSRGYFFVSAVDEGTAYGDSYFEVKIELFRPVPEETEPNYCSYEGSYYVPEKKICEASANCPTKYAAGWDVLERCRQCMSDTRSGLGINLSPGGSEEEDNPPPPPATESCLRFFTGQVRECRSGGVTIGGASCCGISGMLKDMCKNEEKALKKMREASICVYVGEYCSKKVLGQCVEKKRSYCCFNSNLARIFQQCGRGQLGISWGSGKNPNCRGFTTEEFSSINFSDPKCQQLFSEYVNTMLSRLNLTSSVNDAMSRVQGWIGSQMQDFVNYGREPKRGN